jgi:hypothetical protein
VHLAESSPRPAVSPRSWRSTSSQGTRRAPPRDLGDRWPRRAGRRRPCRRGCAGGTARAPARRDQVGPGREQLAGASRTSGPSSSSAWRIAEARVRQGPRLRAGPQPVPGAEDPAAPGGPAQELVCRLRGDGRRRAAGWPFSRPVRNACSRRRARPWGRRRVGQLVPQEPGAIPHAARWRRRSGRLLARRHVHRAAPRHSPSGSRDDAGAVGLRPTRPLWPSARVSRDRE